MSIWDIGQWTINPLPVTGNEMFDYFFTVVSFFGLLAFAISMLIKVVSRS